MEEALEYPQAREASDSLSGQTENGGVGVNEVLGRFDEGTSQVEPLPVETKPEAWAFAQSPLYTPEARTLQPGKLRRHATGL